jgi:hypothetical protein
VTARLRRRDGERGQGLVEFTLLLPVFTLLLLAMLEFGFLFDHTLTIQYASREGARVGSALVNGGGDLGCGALQSPNRADVDPFIIAAVTRVLNSPGSRVNVAQVPTITIYKADSNGNQVGSTANVWRRNPGAGPPVDGKNLDYTLAGGDTNWPACTRTNGATPDSIGIRLTYTYKLQTALGSVLGFFGGSGLSQIAVSDRTIMAMNPTD